MRVRSSTVTALLALLSSSGCDFAAKETERQPSAGGEYGSVVLALTSVPMDVQCLKVIVTGNQTVARSFPLVPGTPATLPLGGLPLGNATVYEEAYDAPCDLVTGSTPATWVAQAPVPVVLAASTQVSVTVVLRRPGGLQVTSDFQDTGAATITPNLWMYGEVPVGMSGLRSFTIHNPTSGAVPLAPALSGNAAFSIAMNGCGATLAAGASCSLSVAFRPVMVGQQDGYLVAQTGKPGASLFGVGAPSGSVVVTPASHAFGEVVVGGSTMARGFTISNETSAPVGLMVSLQGAVIDFQITGNDCPSLLNVGQSCLVLVSFTPRSFGAKTATLAAGATGATAQLNGFGLHAGSGVEPPMHSFGTVPVGMQSAPRAFVLTNNSSMARTIVPALSGSAFLMTADGCTGRVLMAGDSCTVDVAFKPPAQGSHAGALAVDPTKPGAPLGGVGGLSGNVRLTPVSASFGTQPVGSQSGSILFTVKNETDHTVTPSFALGGMETTHFEIASSTCTGMLLAGAACTIQVVFAPKAVGLRMAHLTVLADGMTASATLTGTGAGVTVSPSSFSFGPVVRGTQSPAQTFTVHNGLATATTLAPLLTGSNPTDFTMQNGCPTTLMAGGQCTIQVRMSPPTSAPSGLRRAVLLAGTSLPGALASIDGTVWLSQDVGAVGTAAGSTTVSGGQLTVRGAGADIFGSADAFHFAHQTITGDATIVARVNSVDLTHDWAKAAVMMRAGTGAGAPYAAALVTPKAANFYRLQTRVGTGGTTSSTSGGTGVLPAWLRLVRAGNTFTASWSSNGMTWSPLGNPATIMMPSTIAVGLAVTSHRSGTLASGTFGSVTISQP